MSNQCLLMIHIQGNLDNTDEMFPIPFSEDYFTQYRQVNLEYDIDNVESNLKINAQELIDEKNIIAKLIDEMNAQIEKFKNDNKKAKKEKKRCLKRKLINTLTN